MSDARITTMEDSMHEDRAKDVMLFCTPTAIFIYFDADTVNEHVGIIDLVDGEFRFGVFPEGGDIDPEMRPIKSL